MSGVRWRRERNGLPVGPGWWPAGHPASWSSRTRLRASSASRRLSGSSRASRSRSWARSMAAASSSWSSSAGGVVDRGITVTGAYIQGSAEGPVDGRPTCIRGGGLERFARAERTHRLATTTRILTPAGSRRRSARSRPPPDACGAPARSRRSRSSGPVALPRAREQGPGVDRCRRGGRRGHVGGRGSRPPSWTHVATGPASSPGQRRTAMIHEGRGSVSSSFSGVMTWKDRPETWVFSSWAIGRHGSRAATRMASESVWCSTTTSRKEGAVIRSIAHPVSRPARRASSRVSWIGRISWALRITRTPRDVAA